ncbi:SRR1-like protein [Anticarsia gemmatalis]|uniref:SRR1-like protein n=1 Tax=Anticarsia gemmatalis TaxID=129554 RepID=UPI003F759A48
MSNPNFDSDGFQKVKSKRSSKNKPTKIPAKETHFDNQNIIIDVEKVIQRIRSSVDDLRLSDYLEGFLKSVSSLLDGRSVVEIVCLGLGHISECNISRYQLALLLCLKEHCNPQKVLTHDPIFYKGECEVLNKLGLEVITENNEGGYVISGKGPTIVYLPHCPKQLTNNFLWSNWGPNLENCVLICNSFGSLIDNQPSRILSETVPYIYKIFPNTTEHSLDNNFKFTDIFNDTSIHQFSKKNLEKVDSDFWKKGSKPSYENTEEFITSLMVQKLNI